MLTGTTQLHTASVRNIEAPKAMDGQNNTGAKAVALSHLFLTPGVQFTVIVGHVKKSERWVRFPHDFRRLELTIQRVFRTLARMIRNPTRKRGNSRTASLTRRVTKFRGILGKIAVKQFQHDLQQRSPSSCNNSGQSVNSSKTPNSHEGESDEKGSAISPMYHITADDPPALFVHGTADRIVPLQQAQIAVEKLKGVGVEAELHAMEGRGHSVGMDGYRFTADWFNKILK